MSKGIGENDSFPFLGYLQTKQPPPRHYPSQRWQASGLSGVEMVSREGCGAFDVLALTNQFSRYRD